MDKISFSQFAAAVRPLLSNGEHDAEYTRKLLQAITYYDDEDGNPIHEWKSDTLRKYYSGRVSLSGAAKKIVRNIDKEKFSEAISSAGFDILHDTYRRLSVYWPMPDETKFPEYCSDLFESIIVEATKGNRTGQSPQNLSPDGLFSESQSFLLEECDRLCLCCQAPLLHWRRGGVVEKDYHEVRIIPPGLDYKETQQLNNIVDEMPRMDSLEDRVLLCPQCAADYTENYTPEKFKRILTTKREMQRNKEIRETVDNLQLEENLAQLLASLSSIEGSYAEEILNYDAHVIEEKIPRNQVLLRHKVSSEVSRYYGFIRGQLQLLGNAGEIDVEAVLCEVRLCFKQLNQAHLSHTELFEEMAKWISAKTGCKDILACEIVVSYFVQDCEVFDAFAEQNNTI